MVGQVVSAVTIPTARRFSTPIAANGAAVFGHGNC
jgi:hypothetical protein